MGQFPAGSIEINGKFPVDVNGDAGAGWHEDRIKALGLALLEPFRNFIATAGDGLAQHEGASITSDTAGHTAGIAHH
jgi:hypothetical protein